MFSDKLKLYYSVLKNEIPPNWCQTCVYNKMVQPSLLCMLHIFDFITEISK